MVCGDTMNYWIKRPSRETGSRAQGLDVLLINDKEARMLAKNDNLLSAALKSSRWVRRR